MQFSDTTNKSGILQEIESILFSSNYGVITSDTSMLNTFTRYCNQAYNQVITDILESDGKWQYDDTTYTDYPIGVGDLEAGQKDYQLTNSYLKILGVSVKDASGMWIKLRQFDPSEHPNIDRDEIFTEENTPICYDIMANSIFLYPTPSASTVTLAEGLKVYYQRPPNYYVSTDTTKVTGIPIIFIRLIPLWASFYYCQANNMIEKSNSIVSEIKLITGSMKKLMFNRNNADGKIRVTTARVRSR